MTALGLINSSPPPLDVSFKPIIPIGTEMPPRSEPLMLRLPSLQ